MLQHRFYVQFVIFVETKMNPKVISVKIFIVAHQPAPVNNSSNQTGRRHKQAAWRKRLIRRKELGKKIRTTMNTERGTLWMRVHLNSSFLLLLTPVVGLSLKSAPCWAPPTRDYRLNVQLGKASHMLTKIPVETQKKNKLINVNFCDPKDF